MENEPLSLIIILTLITLVLAVVSVFAAEKKLKSLNYQDTVIPKFSVQVEYTQEPLALKLNNRHDCNARSLRKCMMDDYTTLLGCKELTARCHHFDFNTSFYENGFVSVIPRNSTYNEGYALSMEVVVDSCNPFHGDIVLVTDGSGSNGYILGCWCKNPGYIGNDSVLDSCNVIHICDGKIDNINQPLENINCVCDETEYSARYDDGLPVCKPLTVIEANKRFDDWSHIVPWSCDRLIGKRVYNATVRDNLKTSVLLDPCSNAITDTTVQIPGAYYNEVLKTCFYKDYGLPVRTGALQQNKNTLQSTTIDGALPSGRHKYLRLIDNVCGKRKIVNVRTTVKLDLETGGPSNLEIEVNVTLPYPLGIGKRAQFLLSTADQMLAGRCTGSWPSYSCEVTEYFSRNMYGIPTTDYRAPPGPFLWATDTWEKVERMVSSGVVVQETGVALVNSYLDATGEQMRYYGIKLCNKDEVKSCYNGMLSFNNVEDYMRHKNVLT